MTTVKYAQSPPRFYCEKCEYKTNKKSSYDVHLLCIKHNLTTPLLPTCKTYSCSKCSKPFNDRTGLWRHGKKKCVEPETPTDTKLLTDAIMKLVEQNSELMEMLQSNKTNTPTNITTNNVNNNSFNLNVYLNETCKEALNINEFVDSLVLNINDLENTARIGYANGISKIFLTGIQKLEVCKRPIHCSDMKRNTLYIKSENKWVKETDDKPILTKAIKKVANKNIQNIFEWQKRNPEYREPESKQNDRYNKLICETMSGSSNEEQLKNYEKIVSNITKEVFIEKG